MIEVVTPKPKKITVYEILEYSLSELIDYAPPGAPLFWQAGIVFFPIGLTARFTDEALIRDNHHIMRAFFYARLPKYTSEIKNAHSQEIQIIIDKSIISKNIIAHIKNTTK